MRPDEGIEMMRQGGAAYTCVATEAYALIAKYFLPHEICDVNEILFRSLSLVAIMAVKESPYQELFRTKYVYRRYKK